MFEFAKASNPDITIPKFFYYTEEISKTINRDYLINWFTSCTRSVILGIPDNLKGEDFIGVKCDLEESLVMKTKPCVHVHK